MKRYLLTLLTFIVAYALAGCGGVGANYSGPTPFTGSYIGTWSLASTEEFGVLSITVSGNAELAGTVRNIATGEDGILSGNIERDGKFEASIAYAGGATVPLNGLMGGGTAANGVSGDATYVRPGAGSRAFEFSADTELTPVFNGTFQGTYAVPNLGIGGTLTLTSSADGQFFGTFNDGAVNGRIEGATDVFGSIRMVFIQPDDTRLASIGNVVLWVDQEQVYHLDFDGNYRNKVGTLSGMTFNTTGAGIVP